MHCQSKPAAEVKNLALPHHIFKICGWIFCRWIFFFLNVFICNLLLPMLQLIPIAEYSSQVFVDQAVKVWRCPKGSHQLTSTPLLEKTSTQQLTRWTQQQMDTPATNQHTHVAGSNHTWTPIQLTCSFNAGRWSLFQHQHAQIEAANFHHFLHSSGTWEKAHSQIEILYLQ